MAGEVRSTVSTVVCLIAISCIFGIHGRGYQPGAKVGDGYGQESVWSKDQSLPVWASLLVAICVIALVIVSCCCYRKCRLKNNKWSGLASDVDEEHG